MKRLALILAFPLIVVIACTDTPDERKKTQTHRPEFHLRRDLFDFSRKMTESDTLIILAELSVCTSQGRETNILTKKGDDAFIRTYAEGDFVDGKDVELS